jgi:hypothetical protein
MVEIEERKQTKGNDLKVGGEKNRVSGGGPSFGQTLTTGGSHCRSEICMVVLKETK